MANTATGTISKISDFTTSGNTIGREITITIPAIVNRPTYTFALAYSFGNASGSISNKFYKGNGVWKWAVPLSLAEQIPNAQSGACSITCTARKPDGTVANTTTKSVTLKTEAGLVRPVIMQHTAEDVNETTLALTGNGLRFVNGFSKARATIKADALYGATIKGAYVKHGGVQKGGVPTGNATEAAYTLQFEPTQDERFEYIATDSRGYTVSLVEFHTEVAYSGVTCAISPDIPQPDGTMAFKVQGAFWGQNFGAKDNALTVFYRIKAGDGEFGAWQQVAAANVTADATGYEAQASIKVDYSQKVTIQAKAVDLLTEAESEEKTVRAFPVFYWGENDFIFDCLVRMKKGLYFEEVGKAIFARDADGEYRNVFQGKNGNGNTLIGWGNYANADGNTYLYGHDVQIGVSNLATPGLYRPYVRQGDSRAVNIQTAGYCTQSKTEVRFFVPFSRPIVGSPTVAASSPNNGLILRQNGNYTHGSSASKYVKPTSYEAICYMSHGVWIIATLSDTTNAVTNAPIGVHWSGTLTFS